MPTPASSNLAVRCLARRLDLVALTLDFSLFQAVRIMTVKSINLGLDFHVFCQTADGRFRPVQDLDLSGKFRLDLNDLAADIRTRVWLRRIR